jgi:hypothetical protein
VHSHPTVPADEARAYRRAFLWLPLLLGLASLALGQDSNWDLRNYHLYNPYAWLHGRLGIDLAPAGMQSYFNPLLDVFQAGLYHALPAPLVGFLLGWLQGLNAILLIAIGRCVLPSGTPARVVIALAVAGCLAAGFLSELGNAMGDNLTALLVLGGLLLVLQPDGTGDRGRLLAAGVLVGLATGLKLTNAIHALALGATLLLVPIRPGRRLLPALWLGLGGVAGLALTSGYWFWHLWQLFGNPLFPQFGSLWPHPLAADAAVADLRFLPRNLWERLAWPVVIALDPSRVSEVPLRQLAWPVLYLLFLAWGARNLWCLRRASDTPPLHWQARRLASFVGLGFVVWTTVFSIYRYLVPIELLAPLLCWVLLQHLLPSRWPARLPALIVTAVALVGLDGYRHTWGHAGWAGTAFRVEQPPLPPGTLAHGTVLLVGKRPMAWRIPYLPDALAYIGIDTNFPAGPGYRPRVQAILRQRGGRVWAMLPAADYPRGNFVARLEHGAGLLGWNDDAAGCARLDHLRARLHLRAALAPTPDGGCRFTLRAQDRIDLAPLDHATEARALEALAPYGLHFSPAGCRRLDSWIGRSSLPYLWCEVQPIH